MPFPFCTRANNWRARFITPHCRLPHRAFLAQALFRLRGRYARRDARSRSLVRSFQRSYLVPHHRCSFACARARSRAFALRAAARLCLCAWRRSLFNALARSFSTPVAQRMHFIGTAAYHHPPCAIHVCTHTRAPFTIMPRHHICSFTAMRGFILPLWLAYCTRRVPRWVSHNARVSSLTRGVHFSPCLPCVPHIARLPGSRARIHAPAAQRRLPYHILFPDNTPRFETAICCRIWFMRRAPPFAYSCVPRWRCITRLSLPAVRRAFTVHVQHIFYYLLA